MVATHALHINIGVDGLCLLFSNFQSVSGPNILIEEEIVKELIAKYILFTLIDTMWFNETDAEYIHRRLLSYHTKEERKAYAAIVSKAKARAIAALWKERIVDYPLQQAETILLTFVVRWLLVAQPNLKMLTDCTFKEVAGIARYIQLTHDYSNILDIIDILFIEQSCDVFSQCPTLFQTVAQCISVVQIDDDLREMACGNLVYMLQKNPQLFPYCRQQYDFLVYLLHLIIQESDFNILINWWEIIKELYLNANPEHLWGRKDFYLLVNVLVRFIENARSENALVVGVETYLVFSIAPYLVKDDGYYQLDLILDAVTALHEPTPRVAGYLQELYNLRKEID